MCWGGGGGGRGVGEGGGEGREKEKVLIYWCVVVGEKKNHLGEHGGVHTAKGQGEHKGEKRVCV